MDSYEEYVNNILNFGFEEYPRGLKTISVKDVSFSLPTGKTYRRYKDNPLIGFMEGMQFIAGTFSMLELQRVAPKAKLELFGPTSSYGLRVGDQVDWIIKELNNDPSSRRAVLVLADQKERLEDRPCTTSMQFYMRDVYSLNTTVTMRSSDAVYGLPYDFIQFGMMSIMIANCLGVYPNITTINIANAHIYDNTKHLAKNFDRWEFDLPKLPSLVEYEKWALASLGALNESMISSVFKFKKG